jgi:hypothetical protein
LNAAVWLLEILVALIIRCACVSRRADVCANGDASAESADRQTAAGAAPSEELAARTTRLKEKLAKLEEKVKRLKAIEREMLAAPDQQSPQGWPARAAARRIQG